MSTSERKMSLAEADAIAAGLVRLLAPGCRRIEIAGSIRRRKPLVGDVEIVAIPDRAPNLLGEDDESRLDSIIHGAARCGFLRRLKGGAYYQQFTIVDAGCKLDLFTPGPETWGVVFTQRTGSADFAHRLMTCREGRTSTGQPGLMPVGMRVFRARLWRGGELIPTPEEEDFFREIRVPWVPPEDRR